MTTARIVRDPDILGGKPVIEGTRLSVELILGLFAGGWSRQDLLENYPNLTDERINACFAYARELVLAAGQTTEAAE